MNSMSLASPVSVSVAYSSFLGIYLQSAKGLHLWHDTKMLCGVWSVTSTYQMFSYASV